MKYYCVKQNSFSDCGPAAIATIVKQYGYHLSIDKIRNLTGTDKQGTTLFGMRKALKDIGFSAKVVRCTDISSVLSCSVPCIAHMTNSHNGNHYVVIHKVTKKTVIIADPNKGIIKLHLKDFLNSSIDYSYYWSKILIVISPTDKLKNVVNDKHILISFFKLIKPHKKLISIILIASGLYTLLGVFGAFYYKILIDYILPGQLETTLIAISIGVIFLNVFKVLLDFIRNNLLLYLSQKLDISILFGYYEHVVALPMQFFASRKIGEIISRFYDASKVREAISGAALTVCIDIMMVLAGGVILFLESQLLFFIAFIIVILYAVIVIVFDPKFKKYNEQVMENDAQLNSYFIEVLNGIQTVKSFSAYEKVNFECESKFIYFLKSILNLGKIRNSQNALKTFVELVGGVVILWVGAISVLNSSMTIGELITFSSLLVYFLEPIKNLINLQPQIKTATVAAERLVSIINLDEEVDDSEIKKEAPKKLNKDIVFNDVNFRYGGRRLILEDISIKIKGCSNVAIVGESGTGKSTLSKLLLRLYKPENGKIEIGNLNIEDIQLDYLRKKISYVTQDIFLFSGTIYENLTLGVEKCDLEKVIMMSKISKIHDFIDELPYRYETKIDENGMNLSGGQKQRLALTRALLKEPDILILDEATSNLDFINENDIIEAINMYCNDVTVIFITHRLNTVKNCDMIYVMDSGKIVESGSHLELINNKGKYYDLINKG